jgi:hypothetical protein
VGSRKEIKMRNIFGWDLPPGCTHADIDRAAGVGQPCDMCGLDVDSEECICEECPVCGAYGDPYCYEHHGMPYNMAQYMTLKEQEAKWEEEARAENEYYEQMMKEEEEWAKEMEQGGTDGCV